MTKTTMQIELFYDSKSFIFKKGATTVGRAPFDTLALSSDNASAEDLRDMQYMLEPYQIGEVLTERGVKGVVLGPPRAYTHEVTLHGCGNVDYQQYADIAPKKTVRVNLDSDISAVVMRYQRCYDMGVGNCQKDHGKVWQLPTKPGGKRRLIGYINYGGRFETAADRKAWEAEMRAKYPPTSA